MATGTANHGSPQPQPARDPRRTGRVVEYQQYIDTQLGRTRRRVKWVDLWTALTTLAVGFVAYLLVAAVVDHWIVPGGLGSVGRWLLLICLLGGIVVHLVMGMLPLVVRRVNPVYAAAAIEQGGRMKNTLINFLLLRRQPEGVSDGILDAIKEQAAVRLSNVPEDAPVDRTALIRWCYVLAAILVTAVGYAFVSPKDSFRSIRRVMTPWAELAAPTRVRFESVDPGNADKHRDDIVEVKVRAAGLRKSDAVVLFYSATGNPADDIALPMQSDDGRYLWKTVLPPGSEGLKQDLFYYVQAGDASSPRYRIRVLSTPVINVRSVRYDYPAYTGLPPRTVEKQGDLKALEGTHVTLTAEANQAIAAAYVAFDQARSKDVQLKPNGLEAVGGFDLTLKKDRETPVHSSYVLRFSNIDGEENPKPVEHRIDVMADQPPEIRVTEPNTPPEKEIALPVGVILRVTLAARDPDFQLGDLTVVVERNGGLIREERILSGTRYGDYSSTAMLSAELLKLKAGDKFTFRGRAADNKAPKPNVVETPRYTVVIAPANGAQQPNDGQNQNPPPNQQQQPYNQPQPQNDAQQPNDKRPQPGNDPNPPPPQNGNQQPNAGEKGTPNDRGDGQPGQPRDGEKGGDQNNQKGDAPAEPKNGERPKNGNDQQPGNKNQPGNEQRPNESKKNDEPIDPTVDPGKAFDELNKHFEQQDKQNEPQQKPDQPKDPNGGAPQPKQEEADSQPQQQPGGGEKKNDQPGDAKQKAGQEAGDKGQGAGEKGQQSGGGGDKQPQEGDAPAEPPKGANDMSGTQPKNDSSTGGPDKQGNEPGEKQPGPDGGKSGDERKAGGADGVGKQGSEGGGEKNPGGKPNNQPAQNPGNEAAQPGGNQGTKSKDPTQQNPAERKSGENDGGREAGRKPGDDNTPGEQSGSKQPTEPKDGTQQGTGSQQQQGPGNDKTGQEPDGNKPGEKPDGAKPGESPDPNERRPGEKTNEGQPGVKRDTNSSDAGSGTQAGGDESKPDDKGKRPDEQNPDGTPGKPSVNEKQPAGNTKNPGGNDGPASESEGSPKQDEQAKPRDKTGKQGSDNQNETGKSEEKSPGSNSKQESDSQGQTSGDRSGEGEEGAGQKANKKGTGAAGENTPGDQGGGAAQQEGDQATSDKGGDKVKGNDPSKGKPSERTGEGSQTDRGGDKAGGDAQGSSKNDEAAKQGSGEQQTGGGPGSPNNGKQPGERRPPNNDETQPNQGPNGPGGGGNPDGDREPSPEDVRTVAPPADEANLDYTRQVTDLTLDRLKQQLDKGEVDPELLKKFTSREALEDFVKRWESMRQAAGDSSPAAEPARKQFQDTLKSLGLRPKATTQQGAMTGGDDGRAQRGARRSEPPAKYADQYRAYTTGVGQSEK